MFITYCLRARLGTRGGGCPRDGARTEPVQMINDLSCRQHGSEVPDEALGQRAEVAAAVVPDSCSGENKVSVVSL